MHLITGYEDKKARIEMVPLIDVVFLLLVFFIYAMFSMSYHHVLPVSLPSASGAPENYQNIQIALTESNILLLNGQVVEMDRCVERTAELVRETSRSVMISGDRKADLGIGIELLSRLKDVGVKSIAFEVKLP